MKIIAIFLSIVALATQSIASPTLQFSQQEAFVRFPDCDQAYTSYYVRVANTSDTMQELHINLGEVDISQMIRSEVLLQNGFYGVGPGSEVLVELPIVGPVDAKPRVHLYLLQSSGGLDTLALTLRALPDSITITADLNVERIPTTSPTFRSVTFHNRGSAPYPLSRLYYRSVLIPESFLSDTLYPNETRTELLQLDNRLIGRQSLYIRMNGCEYSESVNSMRVYDPRAYFTTDLLADTSYGCRSLLTPQVIELVLKNDLAAQSTLSSISLSQMSYGFSLLDSSDLQNTTIAKGDSLIIRLKREPEPWSWTTVKIRTKDSVTSEVRLDSRIKWSGPRFYIEIDTIRYEGGAGAERFHQFTLTNDGNLPSVIEEILLTDTTHWALSGVEVGDSLQSRKILSGEVRFKGAIDPGVYPVDLRVSSSNCDTVLSRTIVMSLSASKVATEHAEVSTRVYPLPAKDVLNVEASFEVEIKLLDMLGRTLIERKADHGVTAIGIEALPAGNYLLTLSGNGGVESQIVTIE